MTKKPINKNFLCEVLCVNEEKVKAVKNIMKSDATIVKLSETFKILGDQTRTKIIFALFQEELCVCDITALLSISQSATSHQLRVLRNMDIVKCRKEGRIAYYSLDDDHIKNLFDEGLRHVEEK